ncbi:MAG: hypothetical protein ACR2QW_00065 [bacterium]
METNIGSPAEFNSRLYYQLDQSSGRELFDIELMNQIDHQLINVCQHGLHLMRALRSMCNAELQSNFTQYREALSNFVEFVHENLYGLFHDHLKQHSLYQDFLKFEAETRRLIRRIEQFLDKCGGAMFSHKKLFERALYRLDTILVQRHEQEIEFLSPMLRRLKINQVTHQLTETQNRILFL